MIRTNSDGFFRRVRHDKKRAAGFPLEDKHVLSERHVIRRSLDANQENAVLTWYISMYHLIGLKQTRGIKNVALKTEKKFVAVEVYWKE